MALPALVAGDGPVVALTDRLISEGIRLGASDIHVEPSRTRVRVRYRVDGVLIEGTEVPKSQQDALISRLKIMADINIAERRLPQDGRIQLTRPEGSWDLRASTMPAVHGEDLVLRVLDRGERRFGFDQLGLWPDQWEVMERLVNLPNGLVLVTGPTGSGKTTTLYSCLQQLNRSDRKIITVEEPVEYVMPGLNQVPVRAEFGVTFATALRAMLRQAPNVIMVGEIRDRETAEIALHAALTGHMVFSTLHTNDAVGAVARLLHLGVRPFLLSAALRGVVAQRLVRRICTRCHGSLVATAFRKLGNAGGPEVPEKACADCAGTGYRGRVGLFELLEISDEFSQLIHDCGDASGLRAWARARGMRSLREDGARKASAGLTTIEEVISITAEDPRPATPPDLP